jgi:hypothetical protein
VSSNVGRRDDQPGRAPRYLRGDDGNRASAWSAGIRFFDAAGDEFAIECAKPASSAVHDPRKPPGHVLLVYTPGKNDSQFAQQMKVLDANPGVAEDMKLLFVIASPAVEMHNGYYMRAAEADAAAILPGRFSVRLLDPDCRALTVE